MTIQEIRVGNYVMSSISGKIGQILTIEGSYVYLTNVENTAYIEDCQPVPLSHDILEAGGFEPLENGRMCIECGALSFGQSFDNPKRVILYDAGDENTGVSIFSLHQLQNLYFALTGTELEYKEPVNNNTDND